MAKESKNKEKKMNKTKPSKGKSSFAKDTKAELKKVIWPNSKQLVNNTVAVITIVVIIGLIVFILDACFNRISSFGIEKLRGIVQTENIEEIQDESSNEVLSDDEIETEVHEEEINEGEETTETEEQ